LKDDFPSILTEHIRKRDLRRLVDTNSLQNLAAVAASGGLALIKAGWHESFVRELGILTLYDIVILVGLFPYH
jgi:hypothetical protein